MSQPRERDSGRYASSDFTVLCVCGHTLGQHTADRRKGSQPCIAGDLDGCECECECFRKSRRR